MNKVHGVTQVVVHAFEGHEEVAVLEAFRDAGREDVERLSRGAFDLSAGERGSSSGICPGPCEDLDWTCSLQAPASRTHFVYLLHLVKKSTRQQ